MWSKVRRVSQARKEYTTDHWQVRSSTPHPCSIPIPAHKIVSHPIPFHMSVISYFLTLCDNLIFSCSSVGLNDHSYDVEKRPRRTAKPRRPAHDPPKERMSTYSVGVVLRDWSVQFLECCYNILMKVVKVKIKNRFAV